MRDFSGVILDMDGVLIDSEPLHVRSWQLVMAPLGIEVTEESFVEWLGVPDVRLAAYYQEVYRLPMPSAALLARKRAQYDLLAETALMLYPGVLDGVRAVASRGFALAVATTSERHSTERNLTRLGIRPYLQALVTGDDVTRHKPAPDPYLRAAELLARTPVACAVIEDTPVGIAAARAAGCYVLAVTTTHAVAALTQAHACLATTAEALAMLAQTGK